MIHVRDAVMPGINGLPRLVLRAGDGSRAEIYLHGAHVTAWAPVVGEERLYLSELAEFNERTAIRGGIPVIFPQFSGLGSLPRHGFARLALWDLVSVDYLTQGAAAILRLCDSAATRQLWPAHFEADLRVAIGGRRLDVTLSVTNLGDDAFAFTGALHTYLHVKDALATVVEGLDGLRYVDQAAGNQEAIQVPGCLAIDQEIDRIYLGATRPVIVREAQRVTEVQQEGFPDLVLWNPGAERAAALADLEPGGYRRMLCVEAAAIGQPVRVEPGQVWHGTQSLLARS